tara:strand:+ start:277 stop:693 length:417 start_codon:yes stop_codon:yes gene_type:complete
MTEDSRYEIGQVIYLVMSDRSKVVPVKIVEENIKNTAAGRIVTYKVQNRANDTNYVSLESIKADIYTSLTDVENKLISNATSHIKDLIRAVESKVKTFGFTDDLDMEKVPTPPLAQDVDQDHQFVYLDDGTRARLRLN